MEKVRFTLVINAELSKKMDILAKKLGISKTAYINISLNEKVTEDFLIQEVLTSEQYKELLAKTLKDKLDLV